MERSTTALKGGFSPVRRSGSPERRLNITKLEQKNSPQKNSEATKSPEIPNTELQNQTGSPKRPKLSIEKGLLLMPPKPQAETTHGRHKRSRNELDDEESKESKELQKVDDFEYLQRLPSVPSVPLFTGSGPSPKKSKNVTFSDVVQYESKDPRYDDMIRRIDTFVDTVNSRLDSLERNQYLIMQKLDGSENEELHKRCNALQDSLNGLMEVMRKQNN